MTIAVIDYGGSNLRSVAKALEFVGADRQRVVVSAEPATILRAARVVFPGQGAVGDCMSSLTAAGLLETVIEAIQTRPFLGICLGLQSLMTRSDEDGGVACLDLFPGQVRRFPHPAPPAADGTPQKVPHMGWNTVRWRKAHPLTRGIPDDTRFYFVHSYYVAPQNDAVIMAETDHINRFVSAIASDFAFATQFHPEKSAQAGLKLLRNFSRWDGGD